MFIQNKMKKIKIIYEKSEVGFVVWKHIKSFIYLKIYSFFEKVYQKTSNKIGIENSPQRAFELSTFLKKKKSNRTVL